MLPCLSHITYRHTMTMKTVNKSKISKNNNNNNNTPHYVYDDIRLNIHTIAQLDFILFQQVF
jgi:hypothetical protein